MKLTDNEIRDINRYLEEGKPLAFENEWKSFLTKKDRSIEMKSAFYECQSGRRKIAVKVVDIWQ